MNLLVSGAQRHSSGSLEAAPGIHTLPDPKTLFASSSSIASTQLLFLLFNTSYKGVFQFLCRSFCFCFGIMASIRSIASSRCWHAQLRRTCHSTPRCFSSLHTTKHATIPAYTNYAAQRLKAAYPITSKRSYATAAEDKPSGDDAGVVRRSYRMFSQIMITS